MSFTQDELQALNTILEQKLSNQRRDLERTFDQRLQMLKRDFEQQLMACQQDLLRNFSRRLVDQQNRFKEAFNHRLDSQQARSSHALTQDIAQKQKEQRQHFEDLIERSLAAQLIAFEQLINQRSSAQTGELAVAYASEPSAAFDTIEVQTEIPWEELVELINKALDERLSFLNSSVVTRVKETERVLAGQIHRLRDAVINGHGNPFDETKSAASTDMQDIFTSIEQLEHLIESMQMAMTANSALLSNRLYHHQQLPLDRAHPARCASSPEKDLQNENIPLPPIDKQEGEQDPVAGT